MSVIPEWQKCYEAGRAALRKDDYDAAVEFLGQALQLSLSRCLATMEKQAGIAGRECAQTFRHPRFKAPEQLFDTNTYLRDVHEDMSMCQLNGRSLEQCNDAHGDLSLESAPYYLKYGQALLYKAQTERDVYAGPEAEYQAATGGEESDEEEDEDDGGARPVETTRRRGEGAEIAGGEVDEVDEEEEEEEGDLELGWKVLEAARLIYNKESKRSLEEVDVMTALADISLEKEQYSICLSDYHSALALLETLVGPTDRMLAQLCFKLCVAYQLDQNPSQALSFCERAIAVCRQRVLLLRSPGRRSGGVEEESGGGQPPASHSAEVEIADLELLLADMKEKAEELQEQVKAPSLMDSLQAQNPQLFQEVRSVFAATAAPAAGARAGAGAGARAGAHSSEASGNGGNALGLGGSSAAFDAPQLGGSQVVATNLGVVGRGKKKAVLVPLEEPGAKRMSGAEKEEGAKEGS